MALSVRVCVCYHSVCCIWLRRYVCACTISLSAVDGFIRTCLRVLSVCLLYMALSVRVCACTVSLSAVYGFAEDGSVGTCVQVLFSLSAIDGFVGTCMCVYCQSVCCGWLRRYMSACTVSLSAVDGFVGTCVCVFFSLSAVDGFVSTCVHVLSVCLL